MRSSSYANPYLCIIITIIIIVVVIIVIIINAFITNIQRLEDSTRSHFLPISRDDDPFFPGPFRSLDRSVDAPPRASFRRGVKRIIDFIHQRLLKGFFHVRSEPSFFVHIFVFAFLFLQQKTGLHFCAIFFSFVK